MSDAQQIAERLARLCPVDGDDELRKLTGIFLDAGLREAVEALEEITLGRGPYSQDQKKHAENCIESMRLAAEDALAALKGDTITNPKEATP